MGGDKVLVCRDCGRDFRFSQSEQEFYAQRGFSEPTRARIVASGGGAPGKINV